MWVVVGLINDCLASGFSNSQFIGYDTSEVALQRARANIAEAGVTNIRLSNPLQEPLPQQPSFDLVTT